MYCRSFLLVQNGKNFGLHGNLENIELKNKEWPNSSIMPISCISC